MYGSEKEDFAIEFEKNCFITAFDVLERVRYKYDERINFQLVSEPGTPLKPDHVVEKARTYRVKQLARWGKLSQTVLTLEPHILLNVIILGTDFRWKPIKNIKLQ